MKSLIFNFYFLLCESNYNSYKISNSRHIYIPVLWICSTNPIQTFSSGLLDILYDVISKYLTIQLKMRPVYYSAVLMVGVHILFNYLLTGSYFNFPNSKLSFKFRPPWFYYSSLTLELDPLPIPHWLYPTVWIQLGIHGLAISCILTRLTGLVFSLGYIACMRRELAWAGEVLFIGREPSLACPSLHGERGNTLILRVLFLIILLLSHMQVGAL